MPIISLHACNFPKGYTWAQLKRDYAAMGYEATWRFPHIVAIRRDLLPRAH